MEELDSEDSLEVPKKDLDDHTATYLRMVFSLIPAWGGIITEVFNTIIPASIDDRLNEWREKVTETLKQLDKKQKNFLRELPKNEEFISLLIQATNIAVKTHVEEKREHLKNCLIHSVESKHHYDRKKIYIELVESLSLTHIQVLKFLHEYASAHNIAFINKYGNLFEGVNAKLPARKDFDFEMFRIILDDLRDEHLLILSDDMDDDEKPVRMQNTRTLETGEADDHLPIYFLTQHGIHFLWFITNET